MYEKTSKGNEDRVLLESAVTEGAALSANSTDETEQTTYYTYDVLQDFYQVLTETTGEETTKYEYGLERIAAYNSDEKTQYVHDAGGSVVQTITAEIEAATAQPVVNTYSYTPFGEQLGEAVSGFTYNAEYYDTATGMLNLRARQYEPTMMRFSQKDILQGSIYEPISLNRYLYCQNDPMSFSDPSGMSVLSKLKSAVKSTAKAVKSTAKAVGAKVVSTAAKVTKTVAKTVSKVSTTVAKVSSTVSKVATKVATNSNSKIVKSIAGSVAKTADKVTTVANKVTATADKVAEVSDQIAKTYDKIAEDAWADAKQNFASAAKDFNAAAQEAKEQIKCVAEKAGDVIVSAATTAWDYCKQNPMEIVHGALDVIGMIPAFGEVADGINSLIYLAEGDYMNAALSAMALIPFAGAAAVAGKAALKYADEAVALAVKYGDDVADAAGTVVTAIGKYGDEVIDTTGLITKNKLKTKKIYRAVSPEEFDDIFATRSFRPKTDGRSFAAKEFGNSFSETLEFADMPINSDKAAIVEVTIPEKTYSRLNHMNLDRSIFKSGTPVVEPEMLDEFNANIIDIRHVF